MTVMHLIARKTSVLVLVVYAFDNSDNTKTSAPYIYISFIPGEIVSKIWFDEIGPNSSEDRQLGIIELTSRAMAQLSHSRFDKIGSPCEEVDGSLWTYAMVGTRTTMAASTLFGPVHTTLQLPTPKNTGSPKIQKTVEHCSSQDGRCRGFKPSRGTADDCAFSIPDFDSQNIVS